MVNIPFKIPDSVFEVTDSHYDSDVIYSIINLYVPKGRVDIYRQTSGWKKFLNIMEIDYSGVDAVTAEGKVTTGCYTLDGRRLDAPQKGLNIIRMSNGTTRKVFVK